MHIKTSTIIGLATIGAALVMVASPLAAKTYKLKIAHFVSPKHPTSKWIESWGKKLQADSKGEFQVSYFPGAQMGPPPKYYDLVRSGQADVTWSIHGYSAGRFPLTEISNLPYIAGSSEIATKMLNDKTLRSKYLDREHKGTKPLVLFAHQPGGLHSANKPIKSVSDVKGMRIRFSNAPTRDYIIALGGTPVGMPPTHIVDNMIKGSLDGAMIDYGGAGIAFKMGPATKYTTEIYSYVASMCLCMNTRFYKGLPAHLKKLVDDSLIGADKAIGNSFDITDPIGKKIMMKAGMKPVDLPAEELAKFKKIGAQVTEKQLSALEKKGLPARAVYKMMTDLSAKHAKTSRNFLAK